MKHLVLILAALSASTTIAADNGFYGYGSLGQASTNRKSQVDATITGAGITAFSSQADETDTTYKIQAGWRFNPYFAVEGGYVDLGKYSYHARSTAPVVATRDGNLKTDAWNIGLVGSLPINESFSLFANGGVFSYTTKFTYTGTGIACPNQNRSERGAPLYYGVGAAWNVTPNWFLRAEYEVYKNIGERFNTNGTTGTSRADVKLGSIGVGYRF